MRLKTKPIFAGGTWRLQILFLAALLAVAGCGQIKAEGPAATGQSSPEDEEARSDIHLTGVTADLTTSGVLQNRVHSEVTTYSLTHNLLELGQVRVTAFGKESTTTPQGITSARRGVVYLADHPELSRHKDDMEFAGNVVYRVLDPKDPTTNTASLETEQLIWQSDVQKFRCPAKFRNILSQPGKRPMAMVGDGFVTTKDLSHWDVKHGAITTELDKDPYAEAAKTRQEMDEIANRPAPPEVKETSAVPAEVLAQMEKIAAAEKAASGALPIQPRAPQATPTATPVSPGASSIQNGRKVYRLDPSMMPARAKAPGPASSATAPAAKRPLTRRLQTPKSPQGR